MSICLASRQQLGDRLFLISSRLPSSCSGRTFPVYTRRCYAVNHAAATNNTNFGKSFSRFPRVAALCKCGDKMTPWIMIAIKSCRAPKILLYCILLCTRRGRVTGGIFRTIIYCSFGPQMVCRIFGLISSWLRVVWNTLKLNNLSNNAIIVGVLGTFLV